MSTLPQEQAEQFRRLARAIDELEEIVTHAINERDAYRAALLAIREHITPATAYPETVAWVQATVDAVVRE